MTLHTFGDSHSGFKDMGWNSISVDGLTIKTHWIGARTCYAFSQRKLDILDISKYGVRDGDMVFLAESVVRQKGFLSIE